MSRPFKQFRRQLARSLGLNRHKNRFYECEEALLSLRGSTGLSMVLDVGAEVGRYARSIRRDFPGATVHSFEPSPESFEKLVKNFADDPKVVAHRLALASASGRRTFYTYDKPGSCSLLPGGGGGNWAPEDAFKGQVAIEVETRTLDEFCAQQAIKHIDLLKMDVQGAELEVLRGAETMLSNVDLVLAEVLFLPFYEGQAFFHDVVAHLHARRFRLFDLFGQRYSAAGQMKWADALFVRDSSPGS